MTTSRILSTSDERALPPPPPYEPLVSRTTSRGEHQQYAPPAGPPPVVSAMPNMMNANPQSYVTGSNNNFEGDSLASHAQRYSHQQSHASTGRQTAIKENQLELLRTYDTIFIVDDSSSMNVNELPNGLMGPSRWQEARDALAGMVELAARYDEDGIEVHFLNNEQSIVNCKEPHRVKALFDSITPEGFTPTGTKLELLLLQYMDDIEQYKQQRQGLAPKKRNFVIITDGAATDDPESVILTAAMRLDRGNFPLSQIGIQFVQVGNDVEARQALQELDDALQGQHGCRDIVDTVLYAGMSLNADLLTKALLGGINRRIDRQRS